jgi:hypothetical protein
LDHYSAAASLVDKANGYDELVAGLDQLLGLDMLVRPGLVEESHELSKTIVSFSYDWVENPSRGIDHDVIRHGLEHCLDVTAPSGLEYATNEIGPLLRHSF